MGIYYSANTILGVVVKLDQTPTKTRVRGCSHEIAPDARFCPTCGKPAFETKTTYPDHSEFTGFIHEELPGDLTYAWDYDGTTFVIGYGRRVERDDMTRIELPDEAAAKERLREVLEPFGYWNEASFGLYTALWGH